MQPITQRHNTLRICPKRQQTPSLPRCASRNLRRLQQSNSIPFAIELLMMRQKIRRRATNNTTPYDHDVLRLSGRRHYGSGCQTCQGGSQHRRDDKDINGRWSEDQSGARRGVHIPVGLKRWRCRARLACMRERATSYMQKFKTPCPKSKNGTRKLVPYAYSKPITRCTKTKYKKTQMPPQTRPKRYAL